MRPAWQTTEFWVTMISNIVGIVALLGYITPEQSTALNTGLSQIAGALLMIATSFGFIQARSKLRMELALAVAHSVEGDAAARTAQANSLVDTLKRLGV